MVGIRTFDVFDTVLTRLVGDPQQVYPRTGALLRERSVISVEPSVFAAVRHSADMDLCARRDMHVGLDVVALEVARRFGLSDEHARDILAAEQDVERAVCVPVPGIHSRIRKARAESRHGRLMFLSDTPHSEEFLRELLERAEVFLEGDRVYCSAARGASKQHGTLFGVVAADLGAAPGEFLHVGDNRWNDVAMARGAGWRTAYDGRAGLHRHEQRLEKWSGVTGGLTAHLAGAARIGRLTAIDRGVSPSVASIGAGVAMPVLVGFALWVLRQARTRDLSTLYFVARDGEVLMDVTQAVAKHTGSQVTCRFLYGSRQSWHLASTAGTTDRDPATWLHDPHGTVTPRRLLARAGLTPEEGGRLASSPLFVGAAADDPLDDAGHAEMRRLLATPAFSDELARRAESQRELLVRYLEQEGAIGPDVGIVDVGWRGRTPRSMEEVLRQSGRDVPAVHLVVGLMDGASHQMGADLYRRSFGWLFDDDREHGKLFSEFDAATVVETLTVSILPYTRGFREEDGKIVPELEDVPQRWDAERLRGYRQAIGDAVDALSPAWLDDEIDLRDAMWDQLFGFWESPDPGEAAAWGAQRWPMDWAGGETVELAVPVRTSAVLRSLRRGRPSLRGEGSWRGGTAAVSGPFWRRIMAAIHLARRQAPRVRRIPRRVRAEIGQRRGA